MQISMNKSKIGKQTWCVNETLEQINGYWFMSQHVPGVKRVLNEFTPQQNDIIIASFPKTGTTWLKSLIFAIVNRESLDSLAHQHPHELVPFLELQVYDEKESSKWSNYSNFGSGSGSSSGRRIFATHIPYQLLGKTLESSGCQVVYVTRNPKDALNSMWHFANKLPNKEEPWPLDEAVGDFCAGVLPFGPYYDHVLGYKNASLPSAHKNKKVMFMTYEDLKNDTKTHVRRLGDFLGCPFATEDQKDNDKVEEIIRSCSFEVLRNHAVNKSEDRPGWLSVPYNSFFRQAKNGDHKNYLNPQAVARIDSLTSEKFHKFGFMYGV